MRVNFKFLKFVVDRIFELFAAFNTLAALLEQYERIIFSKTCFKVVVRSVKIGEAIVFLVNPYY